MSRSESGTLRFQRDLDAERQTPKALPTADTDTDAPQSSTSIASRAGNPLPALFIIALCVPIQLHLGGLRLSPYRLFLLVMIVPACQRLLTDPAVRLNIADALVVALSLWVALSMVVTGSSIETAGIFVIETTGSYAIARAFITGLPDFLRTVRVFTAVVAVSIPFAAYEAVTRNPILLTLLDRVFEVLPNVPHEQRLGLDRAQFVFDHPILYGLFSAMAFTLALYCRKLGSSPKLDAPFGILMGIATFLSLSSGAFVCVAAQIGLIVWDLTLRRVASRWKILLSFGLAFYALIELGSNRTVPELLIPFVSLNPGTAWTRIVVNEQAMDVVRANPVFGYGLAPWFPAWPAPTGSIDNYWIVVAFRHGFPALFLNLMLVAAVSFIVARPRTGDARVARCQIAIVVTILALSVSVYTVHLWNAAYCTFVFLLGCGMWIPRYRPQPAAGDASVPDRAGTSPEGSADFSRRL